MDSSSWIDDVQINDSHVILIQPIFLALKSCLTQTDNYKVENLSGKNVTHFLSGTFMDFGKYFPFFGGKFCLTNTQNLHIRLRNRISPYK